MASVSSPTLAVDNVTLRNVNGTIGIKPSGVSDAEIAALAITAADAAANMATQAELDAEATLRVAGDATHASIFTETWTAESNPAAANTWEDWDISGTVGVGVRLVWILIFNNGAGAREHGIRTNGSGTDRRSIMGLSGTMTVLVKTDANGVVERYSASLNTDAKFRVMGYLA